MTPSERRHLTLEEYTVRLEILHEERA